MTALMREGPVAATGVAPTPQTREFGALLAHYRNAIEWSPAGHYSISDQRAPNAVDGEHLRARLVELRGSLHPSDPAEVARRIVRLFLRFPSSKMPDALVDETVKAYAADLSPFPLWAIDAACVAVLRGSGANPSFVPSCPSLRLEVEDQCAKARIEAAEIERILNTAVYRMPTESERERVSRRFDALIEELQLNAPLDHRPRRERQMTAPEASDYLETLKTDQRPPPELSDRARARFGLPARVSQAD